MNKLSKEKEVNNKLNTKILNKNMNNLNNNNYYNSNSSNNLNKYKIKIFNKTIN